MRVVQAMILAASKTSIIQVGLVAFAPEGLFTDVLAYDH